MAEIGEFPYFLRELFPDAPPPLARLLQGAAENAYLLRNDYYTMRDWMEVARCPQDDLLPAILLLMFAALEEGSLCITLSEPALVRRVRAYSDETDAAEWARRILEAVEGNRYHDLIGTRAHDHKPIIRYEHGGRRHLYFQKHLRAELEFNRDLDARLARSGESPARDWSGILAEVLERDPLPIGDCALELDADQQTALRQALSRPLAIISGGPGTGKTSIVLTLLRCLVRAGVAPARIALAAPTGRAAQRLSDSLRAGLSRLKGESDAALSALSASTIHQLLAYRPTRNLFARHRENPIPADVVIIDEASMVGLVLMSQLLDALAPTTRLILLGDKDQLPSVEAGAVLAHLVREEKSAIDYVVLLRTNHRSEARIRAVAQAINAQDAEIVERLPRVTTIDTLEAQGGCWLLEQVQQNANEIRWFVQKAADYSYFHSQREGTTLGSLAQELFAEDVVAGGAVSATLFALLDRFRLLTLVREGAWGCIEINHAVDQYLRPRLDPTARGRLFAGAPVLITRNDSTRGLFNGDVGIALRNRRGGLDVVFQRQTGAARFPAEALPAYELGFALTVHKSQGSEYANVLLVVPPTGARRLLTKELIYTAITRAKSLAILCGAKEVLKDAIRHRIVRESGVLG